MRIIKLSFGILLLSMIFAGDPLWAGTSLDPVTGGTFLRNSTAVLVEPDGTQTNFAANQRRTKEVLSISQADGVVRTNTQDGQTNDVEPWTSNDNYLFGFVSSNATASNRGGVGAVGALVRSTDGLTWETASSTFEALIPIISLSNDRLLVERRDGTIWYSDDDGTTWTASNADLVQQIYPWGYDEDGAGKVVLVTYGDNSQKQEIWTSANWGTTWTRTYQTEYANEIDHFHAVGYHPTLDRWIVNSGDGEGQNRCWYSDDATTWTSCTTATITTVPTGVADAAAATTLTLTATSSATNDYYRNSKITITSGANAGESRRITGYVGATKVATVDVAWTTNPSAGDAYSIVRINAPEIQVTRYRDYGHATRLAVGGDNYMPAGWIDLSDFSTGVFINEQKPAFSSTLYTNYCFDLFQHGDLWYCLGQSDNPSGSRESLILVSPDLENWATYYRGSDYTAYGFVNYGGYWGGKLHIVSAGSADVKDYQHFTISPAKWKLETGLVVSPAVTNLIADPDSDSTTGWAGLGSATVSKDATGGIGGGSAIKGLQANAAWVESGLRTPTFATDPSKYYMARAWMKGTIGYTGVMLYPGTGYANRWFQISPDKWTEVYTGPTKGDANQTIRFGAYWHPTTGGTEMWVDKMQVTEASTYYGGGTATDTLAYDVNFTDNWAHAFSVKLDSASWEHANDTNATTTIATYYLDEDDYVSLVYATSTNQFKLVETSAGTMGEEVAATSFFFNRGAQVKFVVRYSAGVWQLSVMHGNAVEHIATTLTKTDFGSGSNVLIKTGDGEGNNPLPHILLPGYIYYSDLTDGEVSAKMTASAEWLNDDDDAPEHSAGAPSGTLPSGTTEATLSLTTDEAATCRYGTTAGVAYASLASTFTTTGGTTHSEPLTGLQDGTTYTYYIRCLDGSANVNDTDYQVSFSVTAAPSGSSGSTARGRALRLGQPPLSVADDSAAYVSMLERYVLLLRELLQLLQEARY